MQKILRSFLTVATFAAAMTVSAEGTQALYLGYCNEDVVVPGKVTTSGVNDPSAAIYLSYEKFQAAGASEIISVRAGLGAVNRITSLTCWVRTDLNGENLAEATITEGFNAGWNIVELNTPYQLVEGQGVYVGYTFHQTASTNVITSTGTTPYIDGSYWSKTKATSDWKESKNRGALYIQAGIPAEGIPAYDIDVTNVTGPEALWMGDDLKVQFDVTNYGVEVCRGVNVSAQIEGLPACDFDGTVEGTPIRFGETAHYSVQIPVEGQTTGDYTVNITVSPVEGVDENPANNSSSFVFSALGDKYRRNVLVEEFTTEKCGYCPEAAAQLHDAIMSYDEDTQARINCACLHAGYYTDQFTIPADEAYTWFYAGGGTYAPAFMINRDASWSKCDSGSPVMGRPGVAAFKTMFDQVLAEESPVSFKIKGIYEESSKKLTADVEVLDLGNTLDADKRLVVYLTEDNIPGPGQASGGANFVHQHVLRAVNQTWGVEIPGDKHYKYTFTLENGWKYDDLALVVYAFNRDASDKTNNAVVNSKTLRSSSFIAPTGVENVLDNSEAIDTNAPAEYYNIQGVRVNANNLTPGLYIVRQGGKSTKTIIR